MLSWINMAEPQPPPPPAPVPQVQPLWSSSWPGLLWLLTPLREEIPNSPFPGSNGDGYVCVPPPSPPPPRGPSPPPQDTSCTTRCVAVLGDCESFSSCRTCCRPCSSGCQSMATGGGRSWGSPAGVEVGGAQTPDPCGGGEAEQRSTGSAGCKREPRGDAPGMNTLPAGGCVCVRHSGPPPPLLSAAGGAAGSVHAAAGAGGRRRGRAAHVGTGMPR